jgi:hypothetical protein
VITPDALLHRLKLALHRKLVDRVVPVLIAGGEGYEQVWRMDVLLHPEQLILPQVSPKRSAGQCGCSIAHVLWIGSTILVCLLLREELRPVENLPIPEDVDCNEDETSMAGKDAAGLHQHVSEPVDKQHFRRLRTETCFLW